MIRNGHLLMAAAAAVFAACGRSGTDGQQGPRKLPLPVVELPARNATGQQAWPVSLQGMVNADVRAKIAGYVTEVLVDEGDRVRQGQSLFRLETESLSEDALAAKANVDAAQVAVDQLLPLVEQHIVSPVQMQTAQARLAQAKAAFQSIKASIGYANINSPIDGVVGAIAYRQGSLVNPSNPLPLTTVSNTNEVYGYFSMNEAAYMDFLEKTPGATLKEKMEHFPPVELQLANGGTYPHPGHITAVTAQVNPATGSVSFRATFPNPEHLIPNGSSGTVVLPVNYPDAVLVPQESTFEQQGLIYVFQVLKDSTVTPQVIDVQDRIGNLYVVRKGVQAGERIVAKGALQLHDKDRIVPMPMPFDSLATSIQPVFQ
ncbi:MAG TPA: efflux RND transporter periplasmic adaptor subunit [Flavobacteriales bacterium]|nr:efflux RND transporter periplasmic adaptor subunit [Flavobacteriales bacterium]HRP82267.1 efflux RND transporter periplasmic adaptor subunit [Flavobacteriales bacterium]